MEYRFKKQLQNLKFIFSGMIIMPCIMYMILSITEIRNTFLDVTTTTVERATVRLFSGYIAISRELLQNAELCIVYV